MAERMIDIKEVASRFGVQPRTIERWVGDSKNAPRVDDFPKPRKIGGVQRWREEDVNAYINHHPERATA